MRYEYSSPLALAMTATLYGTAVYGPKDHVWYYECQGESPVIDWGQSKVRKFVLRFYPGDCNLGESGFQISWVGQAFRDLTEKEEHSGTLRSGIYHDNEQHSSNLRQAETKEPKALLHLSPRRRCRRATRRAVARHSTG